MESRQISSSRKKDVKNHIRTFVLMYFLLWFCEVCISSTNIKNMGPYSSASAPLQLDLEQAWLLLLYQGYQEFMKVSCERQ